MGKSSLLIEHVVCKASLYKFTVYLSILFRWYEGQFHYELFRERREIFPICLEEEFLHLNLFRGRSSFLFLIDLTSSTTIVLNMTYAPFLFLIRYACFTKKGKQVDICGCCPIFLYFVSKQGYKLVEWKRTPNRWDKYTGLMVMLISNKPIICSTDLDFLVHVLIWAEHSHWCGGVLILGSDSHWHYSD